MRHLTVQAEAWPIAGAFAISRGSKTQADVIVVKITDGTVAGRGECVPYGRYGESVESVTGQIEAMREAVAGGLDRDALQRRMPAGAARNALDCALWDLAAKQAGQPAWRLAGLAGIKPVTTAYTLSLGDPDAMAEAARIAAHRPLLKIKLGGRGDEARIAAIRAAVPDARLIVDANEAWTPADMERLMGACAAARVELIEQPLPAGEDMALAHIARPVPVCADESAHTAEGLAELAGRYDAVNIKLDKTGGLTGALAMAAAARAQGLGLMVGCMVATSLSMAPAMLVAQDADFVDLDGPLLLARDRSPGLHYEDARVHPPEPAIWG